MKKMSEKERCLLMKDVGLQPTKVIERYPDGQSGSSFVLTAVAFPKEDSWATDAPLCQGGECPVCATSLVSWAKKVVCPVCGATAYLT